MRRRVWVLIGVAFALVLITVLVKSSMNLAKYRVEVCIDFQGRNSCRTAAAVTEADALRAAHDNACALVASGVTETIACEQTQATRVRWIKR